MLYDLCEAQHGDLDACGAVQMLINVSRNLLPNMAPCERTEVIKVLAVQLRDLTTCLKFHHQSTAG
jgi:hypothetical protein